MNPQVIRPSMKTVTFTYVLMLILAVALAAVWFYYGTDWQKWPAAIPFLLLLLPLKMQFARMFTRLTLTADHKLRFETGFLSRTTRNIDLRKVQDVRVDQSVGQRLFGIGDLSIETAGESSRLVVPSIDHPHDTADHILEAARSDSAKGQGV